MEMEILSIIYKYSFNHKLPDRDFVMSIISIILQYNELNDYIIDINFDYVGLAAYKYGTKVLSFNIPLLIEKTKESLNRRLSNVMKRPKYEEYMFLCFGVLETIFHEFEHIKQIKLYNTDSDTFESKLIGNNLIYLAFNPYIYKKEHNLFTIERLAILKSELMVLDIIHLNEEIPSYIEDDYLNYYNYFMELYYRNNSYPLLRYIQLTGAFIYYDNIQINSNNTRKILKKSKKELDISDRLLYGLPINKEEYKIILDKSFN